MDDEELTHPCGGIDLSGRIIVLDLDDTLYLERDFAFSGFEALEPLVLERTGRSGFAKICRRLFNWGTRGTIFDSALAELGASRDKDLIRELVEAYRAHAPDISLPPDAERFLARACDQVTAIITDGPALTQANKLQALDLADRIGWIVRTDTLPPECGKPHPMAFEMIEQWSGRDARDHVYIADNAAKDFVEPRRRGWLTIQVQRPGRVHTKLAPAPEYAAVLMVCSLDELSFEGEADEVGLARSEEAGDEESVTGEVLQGPFGNGSLSV